MDQKKIEFIESYIKVGNGDYKWDDNHGELVRCKDCKHRPTKREPFDDGYDLIFPDERCPCQVEDGFYSWMPNDDWFCADGEGEEE